MRSQSELAAAVGVEDHAGLRAAGGKRSRQWDLSVAATPGYDFRRCSTVEIVTAITRRPP
jgi:hypothetical protein